MSQRDSAHNKAPAAAGTASRRRFLGQSAATAAAVSTMVHSSTASGEEQPELRIGIIGCGGRGGGAIDDSLSINEGIRLVAAADLYETNCDLLRRSIERKFPDKASLSPDKMHGGLDGYKRVLEDPNVDLVIMTTSPGFRPRYVLEAVQAGKHVFAEKPTCVDPAGYHICAEAQALAEKQRTAIVTGTQYRRQTNYVAAVEQIHNGMIGDIVSATTRYCSTGIWYRNRQEDMSDTEYQLNNWMHFIWLSGDQIAEQAVHNIDAMNWVMGSPPVAAYGSGGRFTRPADSEMWDSMSIDFEYSDNRLCHFMCRQIPGTQGDNGNIIYGTKGVCYIGAMNDGSKIKDLDGKLIWSAEGKISDAYRQEHKDLVDSIRAGEPIVELMQTADSSLTAVLGRVAAYTGQRVTWDFLTKESQLDLWPGELKWDGALPQPASAVPGSTKLI